MEILISSILVLSLCGGNFGHPMMRINRPTSDSDLAALEEKLQKFLDKKPVKVGIFDRWNSETKHSFFCNLKTYARKFTCKDVLMRPEMEYLEIDRENLKSKKCSEFEIKYMKISNLKKTPTVEAFQCPPTKMVNQPHFLMEGEYVEGAPSLYVLQRNKAEKTIHLVAHVIGIPKQAYLEIRKDD